MIEVEQHGAVTAFRMARAILGRPLYWTAAYWLDGLLIDTGPLCTAPQLVRALGERPVHQIAITHAHEDHFGGLALLRRRYPAAPVYAPRQSLPLIEDPSLLGMQRYRQFVWGMPQPVSGVQSLDAVDDLLKTPEYTLRVIETPGHSRDHVSYFESHTRWLFCGDAFIGGRDVAWAPDFDMFATISSLRTLASLRPERMFPGSGRVRRTPLPDLQGKLTDLTQLANQVQDLEAEGYSVTKMVETLFGGEPRLRLLTMGHFSAANLIEACRGHNGITAPLDPGQLAPPPHRPGQTGNLTDSSPKRSSDPDDIRR